MSVASEGKNLLIFERYRGKLAFVQTEQMPVKSKEQTLRLRSDSIRETQANFTQVLQKSPERERDARLSVCHRQTVVIFT